MVKSYKGVLALMVSYKRSGDGLMRPHLFMSGKDGYFIKKDSEIGISFTDEYEFGEMGNTVYVSSHYPEIKDIVGRMAVMEGDSIMLNITMDVPAHIKRELAGIRANVAWSRFNYGDSEHSADNNFFIGRSRVPISRDYDYESDQRFGNAPKSKVQKTAREPASRKGLKASPIKIDTIGIHEIEL